MYNKFRISYTPLPTQRVILRLQNKHVDLSSKIISKISKFSELNRDWITASTIHTIKTATLLQECFSHSCIIESYRWNQSRVRSDLHIRLKSGRQLSHCSVNFSLFRWRKLITDFREVSKSNCGNASISIFVVRSPTKFGIARLGELMERGARDDSDEH